VFQCLDGHSALRQAEAKAEAERLELEKFQCLDGHSALRQHPPQPVDFKGTCRRLSGGELEEPRFGPRNGLGSPPDGPQVLCFQQYWSDFGLFRRTPGASPLPTSTYGDFADHARNEARHPRKAAVSRRSHAASIARREGSVNPTRTGSSSSKGGELTPRRRLGSALQGSGRASAHARGEASRPIPPFEKGGQGGFPRRSRGGLGGFGRRTAPGFAFRSTVC